MKDFTPFEIFILDRLLNSGEDNCSTGAYEGTKKCTAFDTPVNDDTVCYHGIREYFEQHKEDL